METYLRNWGNPEVKLVIQPLHPIPYYLHDQFQEAIDKMEENVIENHIGPVTWLSNPVLVPKDDGKLRITVDLRQVNKAIENTHLPISRVDDILPMFSGKSVFSKLDLQSAFHQVELSRYLTVFRAGDKLKQYKRLTMGTLPASGELNSRLRPRLKHQSPIIEIIHDDIVIATTDLKTHNNILNQACIFSLCSISYVKLLFS